MYQKRRQQQPAPVTSKGSILLHDYARPHVIKLTMQNVNEMSYESLPHLPYSPVLFQASQHVVIQLIMQFVLIA